ncbi:hypothetical protein HK099_006240 [Clydaea vesicula]|uniref:FHA domain-containing protein n=1 Tax=Clydaea vesicula TaxID=447962 RepID=A0AAD5XYD4_9FUNG|nr:hypothetical protein HK099_006240 [Clydaea vesicula]
MWFLTAKSHPNTIWLKPGWEGVVGRKKTVNLQFFAIKQISRIHATITTEVISEKDDIFDLEKLSKVKIMDHGSTLGTFVNGVKISPNEWVYLKEKDDINFGESSLTFCLLYKPIVICISNLSSNEKSEVADLAVEADMKISKAWTSNCSHLLMKELKVTLKVMFCLLMCKDIVNLKWLKLTANAKPENYIHAEEKDFLPESNEKLLTNFEPSYLPDEKRKSLMTGKTFVVFNEIQLDYFSKIVPLAGGKVLLRKQHNETETSLKKYLKEISSVCIIMPQSQNVALKYLISNVAARTLDENDIGLAIMSANPRYLISSTDATVAENENLGIHLGADSQVVDQYSVRSKISNNKSLPISYVDNKKEKLASEDSMSNELIDGPQIIEDGEEKKNFDTKNSSQTSLESLIRETPPFAASSIRNSNFSPVKSNLISQNMDDFWDNLIGGTSSNFIPCSSTDKNIKEEFNSTEVKKVEDKPTTENFTTSEENKTINNKKRINPFTIVSQNKRQKSIEKDDFKSFEAEKKTNTSNVDVLFNSEKSTSLSKDFLDDKIFKEELNGYIESKKFNKEKKEIEEKGKLEEEKNFKKKEKKLKFINTNQKKEKKKLKSSDLNKLKYKFFKNDDYDEAYSSDVDQSESDEDLDLSTLKKLTDITLVDLIPAQKKKENIEEEKKEGVNFKKFKKSSSLKKKNQNFELILHEKGNEHFIVGGIEEPWLKPKKIKQIKDYHSTIGKGKKKNLQAYSNEVDEKLLLSSGESDLSEVEEEEIEILEKKKKNFFSKKILLDEEEEDNIRVDIESNKDFTKADTKMTSQSSLRNFFNSKLSNSTGSNNSLSKSKNEIHSFDEMEIESSNNSNLENDLNTTTLKNNLKKKPKLNFSKITENPSQLIFSNNKSNQLKKYHLVDDDEEDNFEF